jgi:rRNA maturation endonuclease Nob1
MAKIKRWVCTACKAAWFQPSPLGKCPSCGGEGSEKSGELNPDGSFKADA